MLSPPGGGRHYGIRFFVRNCIKESEIEKTLDQLTIFLTFVLFGGGIY